LLGIHSNGAGLLNALNNDEIESVLGHELTHIRNGDVRMMVIAVIIAGSGFVAGLSALVL
jgi:heat shock protein HtpX